MCDLESTDPVFLADVEEIRNRASFRGSGFWHSQLGPAQDLRQRHPDGASPCVISWWSLDPADPLDLGFPNLMSFTTPFSLSSREWALLSAAGNPLLKQAGPGQQGAEMEVQEVVEESRERGGRLANILDNGHHLLRPCVCTTSDPGHGGTSFPLYR